MRHGLLHLLVTGVAVWALAAFLTEHSSKSPVYAAIPTQPPRVAASHGLCHGSDGLDYTGNEGRVWVDPNPSGAVVLWLPGMDHPPCRPSVMTSLDATHSRALAAAVRSAKTRPAGMSNCPPDNGISVTVFFTYPSKAKAEVIRWAPGGCAVVTAPGRDERILPASGAVALRPAPDPWRHYTGG